MRPQSSRLSLYALISAIETDIRLFISSCVGAKTLEEVVASDDIKKTLLARYNKDVGSAGSEPRIDELSLYLDFGDAYSFVNSNSHLLPGPICDNIKKETQAL